MPNWCSNSLNIEVIKNDKKSLKQLKQFIDGVHRKGDSITRKQAEKYRTNFIKERFEKQYRDAADLYVEHSEMLIEKFMTRIAYFQHDAENDKFITGQQEFCMHQLLPIPLELLSEDLEKYTGGAEGKKLDALRLKMKKKYGYQSWYDWNIANLGTKWDVNEPCVSIFEDSVLYQFDTAWSPPVEFLKNICEKYPLLRFNLSYSEPGAAYEGDLVIEAGEIITDETRDYENEDEEDEDN